MAKREPVDRIVIDPEVASGKPVIRDTRIPVSLILGFLADGATVQELLDDYPQLVDEDIRACLSYAALVANGHFVDVS